MIAKAKRVLAFAVILCMLLCLLPGCGEEETSRVAYALPETFDSVSSQTLAENDNYRLEWDDDLKAVMMHSKSDGKVWGTMPYAAYEAGEMNDFVSSPVVIEAVEATSLQLNLSRAYSGSVQSGNVSAKTIDNGIEVTYYFDGLEISVPVQYTLREDSMAVSLNTEGITEGDVYLLKTVSLAPFMCSVANVGSAPVEEDDDLGIDIDLDLDLDLGLDIDLGIEEEVTEEVEEEEEEEVTEPEEKLSTAEVMKNTYLFVPAGNGALMSPEIKDGDGRQYSGDVYGVDAGRYQPYNYYTQESVKMPVFGVKDGADAIVGIIEGGAEQGVVQAAAGNVAAKYSNVAATFYVRGADVYAESGHLATVNTRLSKTIVGSTFTVGFYPLTGDDADYVGMAKRYRDYLIDNGMVKSETVQNAYALSVLGNVVTTSLAFGVPYDSAKSMTTFNEAAAIIKEMATETKLNPAVQLVGYGASGLDIGKVAGGFKFASASGTKKDYAALTEYATDKNIPLFTDFDLVYFKQGGNGYTKLMSAAKTATLHRSDVYYKMLAQRAWDEDEGFYHLLNRSKLSEALDKLLKKGDKLGITGYSLATLGSAAYSDYSDAAYEVKKNMAADVQKLFATVNEAGHAVSSDNANDYAAVASDTVFNVEIEPRHSDVIESYVPFYAIVFKGYVPMYSEALNLSADHDSLVLGALESGIGLGYNVLMKYDTSFAATTHLNIYDSLYSANKDAMVATVTKYKDYYAAIADATIADYEVLENGVTVTTFDNGVVAYTNKSASAQTYPGGELEANGFKYVKGGTN